MLSSFCRSGAGPTSTVVTLILPVQYRPSVLLLDREELPLCHCIHPAKTAHLAYVQATATPASCLHLQSLLRRIYWERGHLLCLSSSFWRAVSRGRGRAAASSRLTPCCALSGQLLANIASTAEQQEHHRTPLALSVSSLRPHIHAHKQEATLDADHAVDHHHLDLARACPGTDRTAPVHSCSSIRCWEHP